MGRWAQPCAKAAEGIALHPVFPNDPRSFLLQGKQQRLWQACAELWMQHPAQVTGAGAQGSERGKSSPWTSEAAAEWGAQARWKLRVLRESSPMASNLPWSQCWSLRASCGIPWVKARELSSVSSCKYWSLGYPGVTLAHCHLLCQSRHLQLHCHTRGVTQRVCPEGSGHLYWVTDEMHGVTCKATDSQGSPTLCFSHEAAAL